MRFSATASSVGSGVLRAAGVVTLTKVKHRRELLFALLPTLSAVHQFIEGFVRFGNPKPKSQFDFLPPTYSSE